MVPGSFGCGVTVFARITTFAPYLAHTNPMDKPIPREAPVITTVLFRKLVIGFNFYDVVNDLFI